MVRQMKSFIEHFSFVEPKETKHIPYFQPILIKFDIIPTLITASVCVILCVRVSLSHKAQTGC